MRRSERTTAVCVIRVERQSTGPLITLRVNYDIVRHSTDAPRITTDVEEALVAVREFLEHATGEQLTRP
jgi:hypothetical protein